MNDWTKEEEQYLDNLADEYCIDEDTVYSLADMLGREELRDGLVSALQDAESYI